MNKIRLFSLTFFTFTLFFVPSFVYADIANDSGNSILENNRSVFNLNNPNNAITSFFTFVITAVLGTIIVELPIFYMFGFRSKKESKIILLANCISVPLANFILDILYRNIIFEVMTVWIYVSLVEIGVVIFESIFLKIFLSNKSWKLVIISVFIANLISFLIGFFVRGFLKFS